VAVLSVAVNPCRLLVLSVTNLINILFVDELTVNDDLRPQYLPINKSLDNWPSRTCIETQQQPGLA